MASFESNGHPRPAGEAEEPPFKQPKLNEVEDYLLPPSPSLAPSPRESIAAAQVGESKAVPIVIDCDNGKVRETLIPGIAEVNVEPISNSSSEWTITPGQSSASPIVIESVDDDINETVSPDFAQVIVDSEVENGSTERTRIGEVSIDEIAETDQHRHVENVAEFGELPMVIDTVNVDISSSEIETAIVEPVGNVSSELARRVETPENEEIVIATGSVPNLNSSNGFVASAAQNVGSCLPSDLGAGSSAVQRTKTSLCSYFRKKGCRHGAACRYAHGEEELKPRPDGSWDPTSERAKKLLQTTAGPVIGAAKVVVEVPAASGTAPASEEKDESTVNPLSKCIVHVPRGWSVDHFKTFLTENSISYTTAKKRKGMSVAFVGFKTPEDVVKATEILDGKTVNKQQLKVAESRSRSWEKATAGGSSDTTKYDNAAHDETAKVIHNGVPDGNVSDDGDVGDFELTAMSSEGPPGEVRNVCDAVTPLAHMTYEEQLSVKRDSISQVLKRLVRNTRKGIPSGGLLPDWILSARDKGGLPCALEGVLASPIIDGYRNKCEFTIGCSADGERVVGFQVGSFREGILAVAEPTDCRNVSIIARSYAAACQEFVRQSELPVWNKKNNSGFWRLLIVREGRAARDGDVPNGNISSISEAMLVVQVCPNGIDDKRRAIEYAKMADFLSLAANSASPPLPLTALLVQDHVGISNVASPDAPLHPLAISKSQQHADVANEYIHDHVSNLKFRISPTAFFQVNTLAAERLYTLAGDWAGLTPDTLLFDVCCGTGTIGLTLAHRVGLVVGIEMNASAVADAQKNAEINNITNCRFVCSKAEDVMESLLKEYLALEESHPLGNDIEEGAVKADDDGHRSQLLEIKQTSSSTLSESNVEDTGGEAIVQLGSSGIQTSLLEKKDDTDQAGNVACLGSSAQCEPTKTAIINEHKYQPQARQKFKNIVAIVDPPRVGLHPVVLKTLRLHAGLHRLVYISCNPQSLLANAVELCTPLSIDPNAEKGKGGWRGRANWKGMSNVGQARQRVKKMPPSEPFKPVKAIAVDLFPHTVHCEMVMLFER